MEPLSFNWVGNIDYSSDEPPVPFPNEGSTSLTMLSPASCFLKGKVVQPSGTVWYGHSMGAIVAYEVLKQFDQRYRSHLACIKP